MCDFGVSRKAEIYSQLAIWALLRKRTTRVCRKKRHLDHPEMDGRKGKRALIHQGAAIPLA